MAVSDWDHAVPASAEDLGLTRRGQLTAMIAAFAGYALAAELAAARPGRRMAARDWIDRQDEIARALKRGTLSPGAWMDAVVGLAGALGAVGFARQFADLSDGSRRTQEGRQVVRQAAHGGDPDQPVTGRAPGVDRGGAAQSNGTRKDEGGGGEEETFHEGSDQRRQPGG